MIEYWEIKPQKNKKHNSHYSLYMDGTSDDVILLLTKLGNICSRPIKAAKPYTFALPILNPDTEQLVEIEQMAADLIEQSKQLPAETEPTHKLGSLQKPALPEIKEEKQQEISEPIETVTDDEPKNEEENVSEESEPETTQEEEQSLLNITPIEPPAEQEEEKEEDTSASDILEERLETIPESTQEQEKEENPPQYEEPKVEEKTENLSIEEEVMRDIENMSEQKSTFSSDVTKYINEEITKIEQTPPPEISENKEFEKTDSLNIPEIPTIEEHTEFPAPELTSKSERKISVANIELNLPPDEEEPSVDEEKTLEESEMKKLEDELPEPILEEETKTQDEEIEKLELPEKKELKPIEETISEPKQVDIPKEETQQTPPVTEDLPIEEDIRRSVYEITPHKKLTFDTLKPASNRFAHAAVMSAMDNLGSMYNPLVLFGPTSSSKTHFLNAMYFALSERIGADKIFATDGVKISKAAESADLEEVNKKINAAQVLMIDDFHLINITEQNKAKLTAWLNNFTDNQKQILITSNAAPQELKEIENKLDFWLEQGWIVELKHPDKESFNKIVKTFAVSDDLKLSKEELEKYFPYQQTPLSYVKKMCRRIKTLQTLIKSKEYSHSEIYGLLTGTEDSELCQPVNEDEEKQVAPFENTVWGKWAFFIPQDETVKTNTIINNIKEITARYSIEGGFSPGFEGEYNKQLLKTAADDIEKSALENEADGVVAVTPPTIDENVKDKMCSNTEHILSSDNIYLSCIAADKLNTPSSILQVIADMAACKKMNF